VIKNIFFDLDDTILDFHWAEREALSHTLIHFGIDPKEEILNSYSRHNAREWQRLERGEITREEVKVNRYKALFDELGVSFSPAEATAFYENELGKGYRFVDGALEMLEEGRKKYRLFLVSNGLKNTQTKRLGNANLYPYFSEVFISEEVGYNKPDARYFQAVFEKIPHFARAESVIIGDSLTSDIKGGINVGITTVWFCQNDDKKNLPNEVGIYPDYTITKLEEFLPLVEKL